MTLLSIAIACAAAMSPAVTAQDDDARPESKEAAVLEAARFLIGSQESYADDPPVGSIPEDEFDDWFARETRRIEKLRGSSDASEWPYEGVYRVGRSRHIPSGYRVGGTAIAAEALLRAPLEGEERDRAVAAALRGLEFVLDRLASDRTMALGPKEGYDVRGWGHAYAIQFLLLVLEQEIVRDEETLGAIREAIPDLIGRLAGNQTSQGGWNYANDRSVSPFMTGATLLILFEAADRGYEVDPRMIEKALSALESCSTDTMSFAYAGRARGSVAMPGSSARSSVATLALVKAGRKDTEALRAAVEGFFTGWDDLLVRKSQQGTHVGEYGIAPYYFFFGHTYAAYAIEELPEGEQASRRNELTELLWRTRESDGTWNDRIFPRTASYSTAMSILALIAEHRAPYPEWRAPGKGGDR